MGSGDLIKRGNSGRGEERAAAAWAGGETGAECQVRQMAQVFHSVVGDQIQAAETYRRRSPESCHNGLEHCSKGSMRRGAGGHGFGARIGLDLIKLAVHPGGQQIGPRSGLGARSMCS